MAFDKNGRCESCGSSIKNQNGLCCECLDWPDKVNELNSVVAELLAALKPLADMITAEIEIGIIKAPPLKSYAIPRHLMLGAHTTCTKHKGE